MRYVLTVRLSHICHIVSRHRTKAEGIKARSAFLRDWRAGRIIRFSSEERGRYRGGFTAPLASPEVWDLKSNYSKTWCGALELVNTQPQAERRRPQAAESLDASHDRAEFMLKVQAAEDAARPESNAAFMLRVQAASRRTL